MRLVLFVLLLIFLLPITTVFAKTDFDYNTFARLPVLHDGRVKPIDSFARAELRTFYGKDSLPDMPAIEWLATSLFDPTVASSQKIFKLDDATLRHRLGLEERKKPIYSYAEIMPALQQTAREASILSSKENKELSADDRALIDIHEKALEYTQILRSFSGVLPLAISLPPKWEKLAQQDKKNIISYVSLSMLAPEMEKDIKEIIRKKGEDPTAYSDNEQQLVALGWQLRTIAEAGQNNTLFRVVYIPDKKTYISPWEYVTGDNNTPVSKEYFDAWQDIALTYQGGKADAWRVAVHQLDEIYMYAMVEDANNGKLVLEYLYNKIAPFQLALFMFAGAFIFALLAMVQPHRFFYVSSALFLSVGLILQIAGLAVRVEILGRPPVGTLYESILFVGAIVPLVAIFVERKMKNALGLLIGGLSGAMLGVFALSMAEDGDTMKMLGAVLNTQFWLATHVLCITIGYGWCLLTSFLAHLILMGRVSGKLDRAHDKSLMQATQNHALIALFFTTVGTILGGIWADQSWGRFWGWDPKENGAMLIALWLIWLIHGRLAGQISVLFWLAGMALLSVMVAVAWVGTNLLGVGLHSYGFIEGVFWGLGLFTAFEIICIGAMVYWLRRQEKTT